MIQLNKRIPQTLKNDLEETAERHEITESEIVREGIRRQLTLLQVEEASDG